MPQRHKTIKDNSNWLFGGGGETKTITFSEPIMEEILTDNFEVYLFDSLTGKMIQVDKKKFSIK